MGGAAAFEVTLDLYHHSNAYTYILIRDTAAESLHGSAAHSRQPNVTHYETSTALKTSTMQTRTHNGSGTICRRMTMLYSWVNTRGAQVGLSSCRAVREIRQQLQVEVGRVFLQAE